MGFFSRKDKIVDLTEDYKYEKKHPKEDTKVPSPISSPVESQESSTGGFFNFFGLAVSGKRGFHSRLLRLQVPLHRLLIHH